MEAYFPDNYRLCVRACLLVSLVYVATGYLVTRVRNRFFNQEWLEKNFGAEYEKYFKTKIPQGGYPDDGNGKFAEKLSFGEWHEFNLAARAFNNFTEWIMGSVASIAMAGLYNPELAAIIGYIIALGRLLYALGYLVSPKHRIVGAAMAKIAIVVNLAIFGVGVYKS